MLRNSSVDRLFYDYYDYSHASGIYVYYCTHITHIHLLDIYVDTERMIVEMLR